MNNTTSHFVIHPLVSTLAFLGGMPFSTQCSFAFLYSTFLVFLFFFSTSILGHSHFLCSISQYLKHYTLLLSITYLLTSYTP